MVYTVSIDLIVRAPTTQKGPLNMDISAILNPLPGWLYDITPIQEVLEGLLRASFTNVGLVSIAIDERLPLGSDVAQLHLDVAEFDTVMTEVITGTLDKMIAMPIAINFDGGEPLVKREGSDFEIGINIGIFMMQQAKVQEERAARFFDHLDSLDSYNDDTFH